MELGKLATEQANPLSQAIETLSVAEITQRMNQEDQGVPLAVRQSLPEINAFIEALVPLMAQGGRLFYMGAGTSGRLGLLDASECPPTFGVSPNRVQGLIAGGLEAMSQAIEGAEDDQGAAVQDLVALKLSDKDVLVGIAASGRTPYVVAGLRYAQEQGALTASLACVEAAEISQWADYPIEVLVGPEIITGSSRLKAGTAQKLVLNMISTTAMIQLGKVYQGYMVDVQATNQKLIDRAHRIIAATADLSLEQAATYYQAAQGQVKCAILMALTGCDLAGAQAFLADNQDHIAQAIQASQQSENKQDQIKEVLP